MATIERSEDIEAWKMARELTRLVYEKTSVGRFSRDFGLKDQIRCAAVSVMSNIAEGYERDGTKEFLHFLSMAKGSCGEVRSHLHVALDQKYLSCDEFSLLHERAVGVSRVLSGVMRYLRDTPIRGEKYKTPHGEREGCTSPS